MFTPASTRASCPHTNCERCHRCELKINIDKHFPKQKANRNKSFVRGSSLAFFYYYSTVGRLSFDETPALFSPPHPSHLIYNMHFLSHDSRFLSEVREQEEPYTCKTFACRKLRLIRDGRLEKLWGAGRGIFEPQEFFFVIKFLV